MKKWILMLLMTVGLAAPSRAHAFWWWHIHWDPVGDLERGEPPMAKAFKPGTSGVFHSSWGVGECPFPRGCDVVFPDSDGPEELTPMDVSRLTDLLRKMGIDARTWGFKLHRLTVEDVAALANRDLRQEIDLGKRQGESRGPAMVTYRLHSGAR